MAYGGRSGRLEELHGKNDDLEKKLCEMISRRTGPGKTLNSLTLYALAHLLWGWCDINKYDTELRSCLYQAFRVLRDEMSSRVENALARAGKATPEPGEE